MSEGTILKNAVIEIVGWLDDCVFVLHNDGKIRELSRKNVKIHNGVPSRARCYLVDITTNEPAIIG